jgi:hypothetical protein
MKKKQEQVKRLSARPGPGASFLPSQEAEEKSPEQAVDARIAPAEASLEPSLGA